MTVNIEGRRADAAAKLTDAQRRIGEALLDGKKADYSEKDALEREIDGYDAAAALLVERDRAERDRRHKANITAMRTEIADLEAACLKALRSFEAKFRESCSEGKLYFTLEASKQRVQSRLKNAGEDVAIHNEPELRDKVSRNMAAQLKTLCGHPSGFGILKFGSSILPDPQKSW